MSPSPDTQDSNTCSSASVVMAAPGSPQRHQQQQQQQQQQQPQVLSQSGLVGVATSTRGTKEDDASNSSSNPYLAGLSKKTRGLKKKMEKIKKTEALSASGKRLNDEQLKLLETKPLLEVALAEHERVKVAMEGVAKDLEREAAERAKLAPTSPPPRPVTALSINPAPEPHQPPAPASLSIPAGDPSDANTPESDAHQDAGSQPAAEGDASATPAEVVVTDSKGVSTDPVDTEEAGAQTDVTGPPPPPGLDPRIVSEAVAVAATLAAEEKDKAAREAEERGIEKGREDAAKGLSKVLRLLHVATRFEAKGERLPTAVDFFSKVLLGKTVPPDEADFDDCLDQSVERAALYLDPSNGSAEVAPGVSYRALNDMVSDLRSQIIDGPTTAAEGDDSSASPFNFFAESRAGGKPEGEAGVPAFGTGSREAPQAAPQTVHGDGNEKGNAVASQLEAGAGVTVTREREKASTPVKLVAQTPPPSPAVGIDAAQPLPSHARGVAGVRGHVGDLDARSPTSGQLGRQASQMEEGILPPVSAATQPPAPSPCAQQQQQADVAALQKRERRPRPQPSSRGPMQAQAGVPLPAAAANNLIPQQQQQQQQQQQPRQQHPGIASPPPRHLQQQLLRSPFPQQPTPPLTPVQMGMGPGAGLSPAAPMPSPSPPASGLSGPSRGSPKLTYGNGNGNGNGGWAGYAQQPLQPAQLQQQQQQHQQQQHHHHHQQHHHLQQQQQQQQQRPQGGQPQHQHPHQQQHSYRPPMHPSPSHAPRSAVAGRGVGGGRGGGTGPAPWADPSPPMMSYPAVGIPTVHQPAMSNGTPLRAGGGATGEEGAANGFRLTPELAREGPTAVHPAPSPAVNTPSGQQQQQQWVSSTGPLDPSPPPVPSAVQAQGMGPAAPTAGLDLERGMTSPWQGPTDVGGGAAVGVTPPPGMAAVDVGESPGVNSNGAMSGGRGGGVGKEKQSGEARPQKLGGVAERSKHVQKGQLEQQQQQQQQQLLPPSAASQATLEPVAQQASAPTSSLPAEVVSNAATTSGQVAPREHSRTRPVTADTKDAKAGTSGKAGNGRGRATNSRSRGGRKGEARNADRATESGQGQGHAVETAAGREGASDSVVAAPPLAQHQQQHQQHQQHQPAARKTSRGQRRQKDQHQQSQHQQQQQQQSKGRSSAKPTQQATLTAATTGKNGRPASSQATEAPPPRVPPALVVEPVSGAWGDESPSPVPRQQQQQQQQQRPQRQQQRSNGGSRNRQSSSQQQQQQQPKQPKQQKQQKQAPVANGQHGTRGGGYGGGGGGGSVAPSHEAGAVARDSSRQQHQQTGRVRQRQQQQQSQARGNASNDGSGRAGNGGGGGSGGGGGNQQGVQGGPRKAGGRGGPSVSSRRKSGGGGGGNGNRAVSQQQQQQQQGVSHRA